MALPTILINATGGSDTGASGAGPGTALTGTGASFVGAVVTLDGSPDLTGVATDGSHVLYMVTSTGVRFFKITGADNGAKTVTVTPSPAGTASGRTWAIGGKRATLTSSTSRLLVDNGGAAGDAGAGWAIEMQSGHTETNTSRLDLRRAGDTTSGPLIIRGTSGAATPPVITFSGAGTDIVLRASYLVLRDFTMTGTSGATSCIIDTLGVNRLEGIKTSGFSGVQVEQSGSAGIFQSHIIGCEFNGGSIGAKVAQDAVVIGCTIHGQSSHGISGPSAPMTGLVILGNLIYSCGGDGVNLVQSRTDLFAGALIAQNTIYGCTGDGIDYSGQNDGMAGLSILNNILSNNGGYGINFTSITAEQVTARGVLVKNNCTYTNTSGACNVSGVLENDPNLNPTFTSTGTADFSIGTNLKAAGYPSSLIGSATANYLDPGCAQRQEPTASPPGRNIVIQNIGTY